MKKMMHGGEMNVELLVLLVSEHKELFDKPVNKCNVNGFDKHINSLSSPV